MDDKHRNEARDEIRVSADMIEAEDFTVEQLRQVLFGESQILPRRLAVMLLERKSYPEKLDDLRRVLDDEKQDARTRHAAATALGRLGTPEAIEALRSKLDSKDAFVLRGIRQALESRMGEIPPGMEFPFPAAFLSLDEGKAQSISSTPVPTKDMPTLLEQISREATGLSLTAENAVSLRCAGRDLAVLLTKEVSSRMRPAELIQKKTIIGLVAVRFGLESQAWSLKYYILTHPGKVENEVEVILTTRRGRIAIAGTAQVKGERAEFTLQAVRAPGATPAEISGFFENGVLRLERILVSETSQMSEQPGRLRPHS